MNHVRLSVTTKAIARRVTTEGRHLPGPLTEWEAK
jgi:hypothetical protein